MPAKCSIRLAAIVTIPMLALYSYINQNPTAVRAAGETRFAGPTSSQTLALSADGLGTLVFGEAPDAGPTTAMIVFDPTVCTDARTGEDVGIVDGDDRDIGLLG